MANIITKISRWLRRDLDSPTSSWGASAGYTNINITPETAQNIAMFFSALDRITSDFASFPRGIFRKDKDGSRHELDEHSLSRLIKLKPHPHYTSYTFFKHLLWFTIAYGNGYARMHRERSGRISKLELIHSDYVKPFISKSDDELWYRITNPGKGLEVVHADNMIHVKDVGETGIEGRSRVDRAKDSLAFVAATEKLGAQVMDKGSLFGRYISYKAPLTTTANKTLEQSFENYMGLLNAHKMPVLDNSSEIKTIGIPLKDLDFFQNRKLNDQMICRLLNMNPAKMGAADHNTYNNAESGNIEYIQSTQLPWVTCVEQELTTKLFFESESDSYFKINMKGMLRGDIRTQTEHYRVGLNNGIYSLNDVLGIEDRNGIGPEGDKRYLNSNLVPMELLFEFWTAKIAEIQAKSQKSIPQA